MFLAVYKPDPRVILLIKALIYIGIEVVAMVSLGFLIKKAGAIAMRVFVSEVLRQLVALLNGCA